MTTDRAYRLGYDCGLNGSNLTNCDYRIFSTPENTKEWERGKRDAEEVKTEQAKLSSKQDVSSSVSCGCVGKELYDTDVFGLQKESVKMKLCKEHIKEKCEEGYLVAL